MCDHGVPVLHREHCAVSSRATAAAFFECATDFGRTLRPALAALALFLGLTPLATADEPAPRHLLLRVRDTPPGSAARIHRDADGGYTVGTGGGNHDDATSQAVADNAQTVSTGDGVRLLRVIEGEPVRVDLPAVQSLQFHLPITGRGAATTGAPPASGASAVSPGTGTTAQAPASAANAGGPAASGVVYFAAVSAFAARFAIVGTRVRIELTPLRAGTVAAPYAATADTRPVVLQGRVGRWLALGDEDVPSTGASLSPTPEPASPASVWVRVDPDPADQP